MPGFQHPNPLDRMFFAGDYAMRRLGLPGSVAYLRFAFEGRLDPVRLQTALRQTYARYPVLAARCEQPWHVAWPRWRLGALAAVDAVHVQRFTGDPAAGAAAWAHALFNAPHAADRTPPFDLHVVQGGAHGDTLFVRWPHALMDGRGALLVLDALSTCYTAGTLPPGPAQPDATRRDFAALLAGVPLATQLRWALDCLHGEHHPPRVLRLAQAPLRRPLGPMHCRLRSVADEAWQQVVENAQRAGPDVRLSDFIRASAVAALDQVLQPSKRDHPVYTLGAFVDHRRQRPGAVCWNLTGALPLQVPAAWALDRPRIARHLRRQMTDHARAQTSLRHYATLRLTMQPPRTFVGAAIRAGFGGRAVAFQRSLLPSLPLGILPAFGAGSAILFGLPVRAFHGFRTVPPEHGFSLDVAIGGGQLNIAGACLAGRVPVPRLEQLMDRFVALLLAPPP